MWFLYLDYVTKKERNIIESTSLMNWTVEFINKHCTLNWQIIKEVKSNKMEWNKKKFLNYSQEEMKLITD